MKVVAIAAVDRNNIIGCQGKIPWYLPEDFKRFKKVTSGNTLIIGRSTFESIGKVLPNRRVIILTSDETFHVEGAEVAHSEQQALQMADTSPDRVCYIGGGEQVYRSFWGYLTDLDITHVDLETLGDTMFPRINLDEWSVTSHEGLEGFSFTRYTRKP